MKVHYTSTITRYEGKYPSLSAFLMSPSPKESDSENVLFHADGVFKGDKSAFTLSYQEEDATPSRLVFSGDTLVFVRGKTEARFEKSKTTAFAYVSAIGALAATAYTVRLDVLEMAGKLLLTVEYFMHISDMVQKNTMRWKLF